MHNEGKFTFSSGPQLTQAVPRAQKTAVIPTEYGIPVMGNGKVSGMTPTPTMGTDSAFSHIDPRVMDVPEYFPGEEF